jgi:hypothetical protein
LLFYVLFVSMQLRQALSEHRYEVYQNYFDLWVLISYFTQVKAPYQDFVNTVMKLDVLTAASMKMAVFWAVAPCILVEVQRRFTGACYLYHKDDRPDYGGSRHFWNVPELLPECMGQQLRIQPTSLQWKPSSIKAWNFLTSSADIQLIKEGYVLRI